MGHKYFDIAGQKYGMLTVLYREECASNGTEKRWTCLCECGKNTLAYSKDLRVGDKKSCGCSKNKHKVTHGMSTTRLYSIWKNMKTRCYSEKSLDYPNYGGRGITICDEWLNDFLSFQAWSLQNNYESHLSIDRLDVNKGYEPANCHWIPLEKQSRNKRTSLSPIEIDGSLKSPIEWSETSGIPYDVIRKRYDRGDRGAALLRPVRKKSKISPAK